MKILAICPRIPAINKNGDQILSFNRLKYLAKIHEIHLICFRSGTEYDAEVQKLELLGITVCTVPWSLVDVMYFGILAIFDSSMPFQTVFFTSIKFRSEVKEAVKIFKPDLIYSITLRPLCNLINYNIKIVVDLIDSLALNFSRRKDVSSGLTKYFLAIEANRIGKFEKKIVSTSFRSFVVSEIDKIYIGSESVGVLPLGVDKHQFYYDESCMRQPVVVFSGNMFYGPNIEAILWFVRCCWRGVLDVVPNAKLVIVGGKPASCVRRLASDPSIVVTGRVESVAAILRSCRVAIAPMQSGSGMQFKVLEAMACAVPVVATTIGLGDIKAVPGRQILIGDSYDKFIELVVELLLNPDKCSEIGLSGHSYVLENHIWDKINSNFSEACGLQ